MLNDGAKDGGQEPNVKKQQEPTKANVENGGNEEVEAIKKELASRDKKIAELLEAEKVRAEEAEKQRQATLSTEEKLNELQQKLDRQDKLASYLGMGFSNEQANNILNCNSETEKANLIYKYASEKSLEDFKKIELSKIPSEPKPKGDHQEDSIIKEVAKEFGL